MFFLIVALIVLILVAIGFLVFFTFFFRKGTEEINEFYSENEFKEMFDPVFQDTFEEYSEVFSQEKCEQYQNDLSIKKLTLNDLDAKINIQTKKYLSGKIDKKSYESALKKFSYLNLYLEEINSKSLDIEELTYLSDETNFEPQDSTSIVLQEVENEQKTNQKTETLTKKIKNTSQMISLHREELLRRSLQETSKLNPEDMQDFVEDFFSE